MKKIVQFLKRKLSQTLAHSKRVAKEKNLGFNLTLEYLYSIFPMDYICPVFGTKMEWLGNKSNSPSLDKILPNLGYVEGNVAFISYEANTLKLHRTPDVLRKIADYVQTHSSVEKID